MLLCCDECPKLFASNTGKYFHKQSVHDGIIYRCDNCDYKSGLSHGLKAHILAKHEGNIYECDKCSKTFTYKGDLANRTKYKHGVSSWKCTHCDLTFRKASELKNHTKVSHEGYRYKCDKCSHESTRLTHLRRHVRAVHTKDNFLTCQSCSYKTAYRHCLKKHSENEHNQNMSDEILGPNKIIKFNFESKIGSSKNAKNSADINKSTLSTKSKDSFEISEDDKHTSEDKHVDMTVENNDEVTESIEDGKNTQQQARKVTYLCPVSDCVFVCTTLEDNTAEQHLKSCHADSYIAGEKFLKL